jgi:flagellar motor switch protein FliM
MLNIAFPSVVSSALLRKLRTELVYQRSRGVATSQENIGKRLLKSKVVLELATRQIPIRFIDLVNMQAGQVLPLRGSLEDPVCLRLKGREYWRARPVSSRSHRAAHLVECSGQPEEEGFS